MINKTISINNLAGVTITGVSVTLVNTDTTTLTLTAPMPVPTGVWSSTFLFSPTAIMLATLFGNLGVVGTFQVSFTNGIVSCTKTFQADDLYSDLEEDIEMVFDIGTFNEI